VLLRRNAEDVPLIRRFLLPRAVLVSPRHAPEIQFVNGGHHWLVHDDADYPAEEINDTEYAARLPVESSEMAAAVASLAEPAG
jgi:hypothetical protein